MTSQYRKEKLRLQKLRLNFLEWESVNIFYGMIITCWNCKYQITRKTRKNTLNVSAYGLRLRSEKWNIRRGSSKSPFPLRKHSTYNSVFNPSTGFTAT